MKKVLIVYKFLPQWRYDFFNGLKKELLRANIQLDVCYGKMDNKKKDEVELEWGKYVPNKLINIFGKHLIYQSCLNYSRKYDLVIVEHASKLLLNYLLIPYRYFANYKLAFWGHGINLSENHNSLLNKFRRILAKKCDWWFCYTDSVVKRIIDIRFPKEKITLVNNSINTTELNQEYNKIKSSEIDKFKKKYGIGTGPIAVFSGGLYKLKRIDFLFKACIRIKEEIADFELIVLGDGPERYKMEKYANENNWIHYLGPTFGYEKIIAFKTSKILLMPGLVGLVIIDSFAMETPLFTTNIFYHSPEIDYLENRVNGVITEDNLDIYANEVVFYLNNNKDLNRLIIGCQNSAKKYTLENMVENFKNGILLSLQEE